MLSPDVPEFIPKAMRGPESSNATTVVSSVPVESYTKTNTVAVSKPFHNQKTDVTAHIKDNSKKDESRKNSQYNSGSNTKSRQNTNIGSNLEKQTYTKVLKRNEALKKSTVASRLFKEQYQEELWPSLPGTEKGKSVDEKLKGDQKSEARISSFPSQINYTGDNSAPEQSNIWQVRKSSNVQQNESINKDDLNYSQISNDSKKISNSLVSSEEGKFLQTTPILKKSRKVNNKKQISNENSINESDRHEETRKYKSENIVQDVHQPASVSLQSVRDMQNISEVKKSTSVTESVSVELPDDNEEWQVQKDRKRKKHSNDKQKKPDAFDERTGSSNMQFRNRDSNYKGKDKEKSDVNLHQKNKSDNHKRKEVDYNSVKNGTHKTKKEANAQHGNNKEMDRTNDKFKGFEIKKIEKDSKDNRNEPLSKKFEAKTNVIKEKNLKSRKIVTQQYNSQKDNLKSCKEQGKCQTLKDSDNTLSKPMSSEEFENFKAERKLKRKEDKMRKRELRLRKEMAMSRGDSKVMVITREFLEAMSSNSCSSSHVKKEEKEIYTDIDHDYPTLDIGDGWPSNEVKIMTNKLKEVNIIDITCEKKVEVNKGNRSEEIDSGSIAQEPTFSYSTALLTSKKKTVNTSTIKENANNESNSTALLTPKNKTVNNSKIKEKGNNESKMTKNDLPKACDPAAPQKKIKMKDLIEFDLMAAIGARTTKQKKKNSDPKQVAIGSLATKNKGVVALGSKIRGATAAAQPKRGKQREEQKRKKKLSVLKKRMKEKQGIDGQSLVGLLMQAKKLREEETSSVVASPDHSADSSKELIIECKGCFDDTNVVPCICLACKQNRIKLGITNLETNILENIEKSEDILQIKDPESNVTTLVDSDINAQEPEVTNDSLKPIKDVVPSVSASVSSQHPLQKLSHEVSEKCQELVKEIMELQDPIHKNSFREYCNHVLTPELDSKAQSLIEELVRFQERQYLKDPVKARIRRRYVCGLKETIKLMGKMSCILVAPDITRSKGPGALDERVEQVLSRARESAVPVIFVLSKRKLGRLSRKKGTVSCFGIINYQGAQNCFNEMMELVPAAKQQYDQLVAQGRLIRPTADNDNVSDDEDNSFGVGEVQESNDTNLTVGDSTDILDINKKIIDSLMINS